MAHGFEYDTGTRNPSEGFLFVAMAAFRFENVRRRFGNADVCAARRNVQLQFFIREAFAAKKNKNLNYQCVNFENFHNLKTLLLYCRMELGPPIEIMGSPSVSAMFKNHKTISEFALSKKPIN